MNELDIEKIVLSFIGVVCIYMPDRLLDVHDLIVESWDDNHPEIESLKATLSKIGNLSFNNGINSFGCEEENKSKHSHHNYPDHRYNLDFKLGCVQLYLTGNYTQTELASIKFVSSSSIGRWVKQYKNSELFESIDSKKVNNSV